MLLATLLCYLGFTALCLSMGRHYADLLGRSLSARREKSLKCLGWGALLLSLWIALGRSDYPAMALIEWFAALMGSAVVLVFTMSYRPRLALSLAAVGVVLSPVAVIFL